MESTKSLVKWVDSALMAKTKGKFCNVPVIPLADLTELVEGLRVMGMDTYCDGPGCGWCERGNRHPFTENAKEARRPRGSRVARVVWGATHDGGDAMTCEVLSNCGAIVSLLWFLNGCSVAMAVCAYRRKP